MQPSRETSESGVIRRWVEVIAFFGVWIAAGLLLDMSVNTYLLFGIPLTAGFQLFVRKRPIKDDLLLSAAISLSGYYAEGYARNGGIDPSLEPRISFEQFTSLAEAGVVDIMKALRCIRLAVGPFSLEGQRDTYEELCRVVAELVEERADEIAAVACRLAASGYLSGSACTRTIELASRQSAENPL